MTAQDTKYAEGASRFAFAHARHAAEFKAAGDRKTARYHEREVIFYARFLVEGLERCAERDGAR